MSQDIIRLKNAVERATRVFYEAQGTFNALKEQLKETFGTDDLDSIEVMLQKSEAEINKTKKKLNKQIEQASEEWQSYVEKANQGS